MKRREHDTILVWGIATQYFCMNGGPFYRKRDAQQRCNQLNPPGSPPIYEPVRITLSWERTGRRTGKGEGSGRT
ncbi:MAG: hypothetical protein H6826_13600 [Planctomycetes bacterium]|nr:hypothetical protein [Planctomycetota bacterium]